MLNGGGVCVFFSTEREHVVSCIMETDPAGLKFNSRVRKPREAGTRRGSRKQHNR